MSVRPEYSQGRAEAVKSTAMCRVTLAEIASLDDLSAEKDRREGIEYSMRWVVGRMIEETARHYRHADFIRQPIDGLVGE